MALTSSTKKAAEKAEKEAGAQATGAATPDVVETPAEVPVDDQGREVNAGDINTKPNDANQPVTPQAIEKDATEKQAAELFNKAAQEEALLKADATGKAPKKADEQNLVLVKNLRDVSFRQPSTGKWISGKQEAFLLNDGWLSNHVKSKQLKLVKEGVKTTAEQDAEAEKAE